MKKLLLILFLFIHLCSFSNNNFYLGFGLIGTHAEVKSNHFRQIEKFNFPDFGLYYGNVIPLDNRFNIGVEVFYLNNRTVLGSDGDERFELHQNLGFKFKPGFSIYRHSFFLSGGILGIYSFDKDEVLGYQIDRFDESYFYGLEYNYFFSDRMSCNLGFFHTKYKLNSFYTDYSLKKFKTFHFSFHYYLY